MNWDYIAGFFDGEGTITKSGNGYKIGITQANKKVFKEILIFTNLGFLHKIKKRKSHWKDAWVYYIPGQQGAYLFLNKIFNKLIVKKADALKAISKLKKRLAERRKQRITIIKKKKEAKKLRRRGLSYRQIGKKLGIDWGYARRLILNVK